MRYALCLCLLMATACSSSPQEAVHVGQETRKEIANADQAGPQSTTRDIQEPPKDRPPPDDKSIPQDTAKDGEA